MYVIWHGAHFDEEELTQLLWAIAGINAWNRVAVAARSLAGEYRPRTDRRQQPAG